MYFIFVTVGKEMLRILFSVVLKIFRIEVVMFNLGEEVEKKLQFWVYFDNYNDFLKNLLRIEGNHDAQI